MGTICFVILNYKTWREAAACAESVLSTQQGQDIRIVLVDNGSGNGSEESLREEFAGEKRVHVIASEKNLGFARGNNLGIQYARSHFEPDFIVAANSDIIFEHFLARYKHLRRCGRFGEVIIFVAVYILFTIYRLKHEVSVEQQISDIKLRFFTNISHELRTPLTLIAGPVEQVLKNDKLPADAREQLVVVERNTNRMLRLVNQILDFRKIQNKKMKMQVQQLNVVAFVRKIMDNFESVAEEHNIDFLFQTEKEALNLWVDADKFEKIVFNLLSNAFKYTPNGKMITVFIREDEGTVSVGVQDQGIGIAENKRKSLFVRFENLVDKNIFNQASSGIGLSLVKELVEMHKATISVDSRLGEGSCFKVDFLKGKEHYNSSVEFILEDSVAPLSMERIVDIANSSLQTEAAIADAPDLEVSAVKEVASIFAFFPTNIFFPII